MRIDTINWRLLSAIHPPEIAVYLRANGWNEGRFIPDKLSIWTRRTEAGEFEILLPLRRVRDFSSRIAEVFRTLELAEGRPQLEIITDVISTRADIVRISADVDAADGSILLEKAVALVHGIRDMMFAAASATIQRAAVLPKEKAAEVVEYMKTLRLGQTERGSYVFQVMSSLEQGMLARRNTSDLPPPQPFERGVTVTLARAVATLEAFELTVASRRVDQALGSAIEAGVSADLCDALSRMASASPTALTLRFSWSPMLGATESLPGKVVFGPGAAKALKETRRALKKMATSLPRDKTEGLVELPGHAGEFELRGYVEGLSRLPGGDHGTIVVLGHVDQSLATSRVILELSGREYLQALEAHASNLVVACTGRLVRQGASLFLREVREFRTLRH